MKPGPQFSLRDAASPAQDRFADSATEVSPSLFVKGLGGIGGALLLVLAGWKILAGTPNTGSTGGVLGDILYNGVLYCAIAMCALRAFRERGERVAWLALGAALTAWTLGQGYYNLFLESVGAPPIPSPSDVGYLLFYPLAAAGLALLLRRRLSHVPATVWLDGFIAALAGTALVSSAVFDAVLSTTTGNFGVVVTGLAYPVGDLLLLALLIAAFATSWRAFDRTLAFVAGALLLFAFTDSVYLLQTANDSYIAGGLLDLGWALAILLLGVAAWQPAISHRAPVESGATITVAVVSALASIGVLVVDHFHRVDPLVLALSALCLVAVCVRLLVAFAQTQRLLVEARTQARTDALTGLANRPMLMADLRRRLRARPSRRTALALADLDGFKEYNDTFGHVAGDALLRRLGIGLMSWVAGRGQAYRLGGDEFCVVVELDEAHGFDLDAVIATLPEVLRTRGASFEVTCSCGAILLEDVSSDAPSDALRTADRLMYATKHSGRRSALEQTKEVLLAALAERDDGLLRHSRDVASLALQTAKELGLDDQEVDSVRDAAQLRDIGKLAIPEAILRKPRSLTEAEMAFIRTHTIVGERVTGVSPALAPVGRLIRSTHERYDGGGYPDGLARERIPLGARIVFVCDAFDAMISDRPYGAAICPADALAELRRCAGTQFDPRVVDAFVRAYEHYQASEGPAEVVALQPLPTPSKVSARAVQVSA